jgi:hypothetical protein
MCIFAGGISSTMKNTFPLLFLLITGFPEALTAGELPRFDCSRLSAAMAESQGGFSSATGTTRDPAKRIPSAGLCPASRDTIVSLPDGRVTYEFSFFISGHGENTPLENDSALLVTGHALNALKSCLGTDGWIEFEIQGKTHYRHPVKRQFAEIWLDGSELRMRFFYHERAYEWCFSGNCTDGIGMLVYDNGDTYFGAFQDGLRHGFGEYTWREIGSSRQGPFLKGEMNGWFSQPGVQETTQPLFIANQMVPDIEYGDLCLLGDCENGFGAYLFGTDTLEVADYYEGFAYDLLAYQIRNTEGMVRLEKKPGEYVTSAYHFLPEGGVYLTQYHHNDAEYIGSFLEMGANIWAEGNHGFAGIKEGAIYSYPSGIRHILLKKVSPVAQEQEIADPDPFRRNLADTLNILFQYAYSGSLYELTGPSQGTAWNIPGTRINSLGYAPAPRSASFNPAIRRGVGWTAAVSGTDSSQLLSEWTNRLRAILSPSIWTGYTGRFRDSSPDGTMWSGTCFTNQHMPACIYILKDESSGTKRGATSVKLMVYFYSGSPLDR